ncbi:translation initiation factor 2 [uncultured Bilophila sp.]|uniref:translation initiation factor 2 n=1 Tax=uncultured Bilophila sp. TaxID=529385 RepID=UPI00280B117D|nr:translation initiation factor 2 [uncultured Bilophila sp.]
MEKLIMEAVTRAAVAAGLPAERVMTESAKDNLTLPRPRVEVQMQPATYKRTGRKLGVTRTETRHITKRELYEVGQQVLLNVLAEDESWLSKFGFDFVMALPKGVNDERGNWVGIRVQKATPGKPPVKRVGEAEIVVFTRLNTLFLLTFTGRVTEDIEHDLVTDVTINPHWEK